MGFELFYDVAFIIGESMVSLLTELDWADKKTGETVSGAKCAVGIYLLIAPMGV
jgi:hypothetical protein